MQIDAFAATDVGPVREQNEDGWLVDVDGAVFAVADGMGGHAAGEEASRIALETVRDIMLGDIDPDETRVVGVNEDPDALTHERLRYCMNQASIRIRRAVEDEPAWTGMGTTMVLIVVEGDTAHVAHVGDSRAYLFRADRLQRLTRDHTVVQQEVDAGRLTPELARTVPHKNILTRSVGYHGPVEPDVSQRPVQAGDLFVLCSDGVTDPMDDDAIAEICRNTHPEDLAQTLVEKALDAGGDDNTTAVVLLLRED